MSSFLAKFAWLRSSGIYTPGGQGPQRMFSSLVASFALQRSAKQARRLKMFSGLVALFALRHSANEAQPKFALFW